VDHLAKDLIQVKGKTEQAQPRQDKYHPENKEAL
jgi:hypothetical protein